MTTAETHWFRCVVLHHATIDEHGDVSHRYATVHINAYEVRKITPKGAWLVIGFREDRGKFVLRNMLHRARAFAAPTPEQAMQDFLLRKQYRIDMLKSQIARAELEKSMVQERIDKGDLESRPPPCCWPPIVATL